MAFALGPQAAGAGHRLAAYDSIGSTNTEALTRARAGERGPLWIVSRAQTEGRGRRGRAWSTQEGNLAASLLIAVAVPLASAATLGFVAALALHRALENCAGGLTTALKWPNDILAGERKLAGILLESEAAGGGTIVVVGMGVNVVSAPQDTPHPATSLAALGYPVSAEHVFAELSDAWTDCYARWDGGRGMDMIRSQWLARAAGLGREISVSTGGGAILHGIFRTLDGEGRLLLRRDDGEEIAVTAGEVHFGPAATARPAVEGS
jgi:BirA family biotin operon repressor/biotin-[acetyl-CoA-carboxylase] ligase